jgi:hypothetical protein
VLYRARCGAPIGTGIQSTGDGSTTPRMVAQGWGWPHRAGGDGGNMPRSPHITTPSWASVKSAAVRSSRVLPSLFDGRGVEEGRERVSQCRGMTPATPHNTRTVSGMVAQWRAIRTAPGPDSQAASKHLMLRSGGAAEVPRVDGKPRARLLTVDFGTPSYEFTFNICTYLIF